MLGNRKVILDTYCEVYELLKPIADGEFWDFAKHDVVPGAIYVIGRAQLTNNLVRVLELVETNTIKLVFSNPAEGSDTLRHHCDHVYKIGDLVRSRKILLVSGGDMDAEWPHLLFDSFLPKVLDYGSNLEEIKLADKLYTKIDKPYKFLFLNGRLRSHRKYLLEQFGVIGLLEQSLWTCLEERQPTANGDIQLVHNGQNLMTTVRPCHLLSTEYEVTKYTKNLPSAQTTGFVKHNLFGQEWGDIYLRAEPYIDTYFSLVTETVFTYPYSFRTEKIWKPIAIGHPWIAVANKGYYRDMHNLGFKTFGHLIDESFDNIDNNQQRIERIVEVVTDLCQQDLPAFLAATKETCKYNQQHLAHMSKEVRNNFPEQFSQFIKQHKFDE